MIPKDLRLILKENRSKYWDSYFEKWNSHCAEEDDETVFVVPEDVEESVCSKCGQGTRVPRIYNWKKFLCDDCLISSSGHKHCEVRNCRKCIKLANILSNRIALITAFKNGVITKVNKQGYFIIQNSHEGKHHH